MFEWTADTFAAYSSARCWNSLPGGRQNPLCQIASERAHVLRGNGWYLSEAVWKHAATRLNIDDMPMYPLFGVGMRCVRGR